MSSSLLRRIVLMPFAAIYSVIVLVRNGLFDMGWLKSTPSKVPSIVLGNLTVGGTGKTPHSIAVLSHLHLLGKKVAFLSRGYGRQSKGFVSIDQFSNALSIGDEPLLMHLRFPKMPAAVCEKRVEGAEKLIQQHPEIEALVLDDAFQHRAFKGDLYILMADYNRPFWSDWMLPSGDLRDNRSQYKRADIIIVSKCPEHLSGDERREIVKQIRPLFDQLVCFTTYQYGQLTNLKGEIVELNKVVPVLGFSGLAVNDFFKDYLKINFSLKKFKDYPDHHTYKPNDVQLLLEELSTFGDPHGVMITSEKDAVKWMEQSEAIKEKLLYLPISVKFLFGESEFYQRIESVLTHRK